jgi:hypothetical protein
MRLRAAPDSPPELVKPLLGNCAACVSAILLKYNSNLEILNIPYRNIINIFINIFIYNKIINIPNDDSLIIEFIKYINLIFKLNINEIIIIKYIYILIITNHNFDFILKQIKNINKYLYLNPKIINN